MKRFLFFFGLLFSIQSIGQVYILNEDFSTATGVNPPLEWLNNTITGDPNDKWHFDNPGNKTINNPMTAPFAIFDAGHISANGNPEVVSFESPFFDASIGQYTLLFFDHVFSSGSGAKGKILAFNGTSWVEVKVFETNSGNPEHEVIDLSAVCARKTNAKIRFQWEGNGAEFWAIDNVRIYAPLRLDAGISAINNPKVPFNAGLNDVKVTLHNFGYQPLTSTTIHWSVNGVRQKPVNWNGNIAFGSDQEDISIGTYDFQKLVQLKIWPENPNNQGDSNPYNDTVTFLACPAFCGTYTIGGNNPDFKTFAEAVTLLNIAGVTCPVIFNARVGEYKEPFIIYNVPGTSPINTVTFQSESGDSMI